jgi:hypothetical protein
MFDNRSFIVCFVEVQWDKYHHRLQSRKTEPANANRTCTVVDAAPLS